jgi:hypothetical protein
MEITRNQGADLSFRPVSFAKRIMDNPLYSSSGLRWSVARKKKATAGGWANLVSSDPGFAFSAYAVLSIADLGRAFVSKYGDSSDEAYLEAVKIVEEDLLTLSNRCLSSTHYGSLCSDVRGSVDLNWRDSHAWDDAVGCLEDP